MTNLISINPGLLISTLLLIISFFSFVFIYNKQQKNRVDKDDLDKMKQYIDQQDRSIHHRIDEVNTNVHQLKDEINRKLDLILSRMLK